MLLITSQEIIETAFVPTENLDSSLVRPTKIDIAQEYFLRPKVGSATFESLVEGANPDFVDQYIKAPLSYFVRYGILEELSVSVDRNGVALRLGGVTTTTTNRNDNRADTGSMTTTADDVKTTTDTATKEAQQSKTDTTTGKTGEIITTIKSTSITTDRDQSNLKNSTINPTDEGSTETVDVHQLENTDDQTDGNIQKTTDSKVTISDRQTDSQSSSSTENTKKKDSETYDKNSVGTDKSEQLQDNRRYQPATAAQIHTLQVRAMSDANVLMNKALRYMERHPEQFPLYTPQPRFYF